MGQGAEIVEPVQDVEPCHRQRDRRHEARKQAGGSGNIELPQAEAAGAALIHDQTCYDEPADAEKRIHAEISRGQPTLTGVKYQDRKNADGPQALDFRDALHVLPLDYQGFVLGKFKMNKYLIQYYI